MAALPFDAHERQEKQVHAGEPRADREDALVAEGPQKRDADEGAEAERERSAHRKVGDAAAVVLCGHDHGDDRACHRADDADRDARDEAHEKDEREGVGEEVGDVREEVEQNARHENPKVAGRLHDAPGEEAPDEAADHDDAGREARHPR